MFQQMTTSQSFKAYVQLESRNKYNFIKYVPTNVLLREHSITK